MAPIRVGLIGLSGQPREKRDGISWAEIAHLQYFKSTAEYQIRALLNSSVDSARAAIQRHELAINTKAYGDPTGTVAPFSYPFLSLLTLLFLCGKNQYAC
jgi:hypothetical protein